MTDDWNGGGPRHSGTLSDSPLSAPRSPLTVVVLAAGLGSRYGGLKQFDPIGPGGTTLLDFGLFDAWRAGFRRAVFVIRPDMAQAVERPITARYGGRFELVTVRQRLDDLPPGHLASPGRSRPWGTTQAVLAARAALPTGFAVLNADDCYGREALEAAAGFLRGTDVRATRHAVVGFRLDLTLSPSGGVNRAVLERSADGTVKHLIEARDLGEGPDGVIAGMVSGTRRELKGETLVSMNLWAFTPAILEPLAAAFERFLARRPGEDEECYLPEAIQEAISRGQATIEVLPTSGRWCGVTHARDRGWVAESLAAMVRAGEYPERMWP